MHQHIVIVSAVFPPESVVSAQTSNDIAEALLHLGYKVTVLCPFPSRPQETNYSAYQVGIEERGDLSIVRLPSYAYPAFGIFGRMYESLSLGLHSATYLLKNITKVNAIYINTWPIFAQLFIVLAARHKNIPIILSIQDIYPESILNRVNKLIRILLLRPLVYLDTFIARTAKKVVVISKNMYNLYENDRGISPKNLALVYNWQDEKEFLHIVDYPSIWVQKGLSNDNFKFMYLGNIGDAAGVEQIIEAFYKAKIPNSELIIAGSGAKKESCQQLVRILGASNISFITVGNGEVPSVQAAADVLVLPTKKGVANSSIPSKMIAYMFSAKPILAIFDKGSDSGNALVQANAGWVGEPENQAWLVSAMQRIKIEKKEVLEKLGNNGQEYALKYFSKTANTKQIIQIIIELARP